MVEFRTLYENELEGWYAHCSEVFHEEDPNYFRKHYEWDPFKDPSLIFVAVDDGVIASTVRVFDRTIWISGRAVKMGGIGEVSTKPAHRRKGYAGTLLRMAIEAMRQRRMPVSILFGGELLYEQMGWRFYPVMYKRIDAVSLSPLWEAACVRPLQPADLPFLIGTYDLYAGRLDGAVRRDEAYWKQWVLPQWKNPYVLEAEGRPAAYCCFSIEKGGKALQIDELCAAPQGEALLPGFLRAVAEQNHMDKIMLHASLTRIEGESIEQNRIMIRMNDPQWENGSHDKQTSLFQNAGMFPVDMF